ncbi:MAG: hypothetical protein J6C83_01255 [Peptococcaceae bacterium]|nr:hypothetical protein [Peptococcaceae bacterium]MBO5301974.1 hypothetical protein [Peptococcaceae bacterium]MBO5366837.1 hypothetical protein [Peptococcaceae bacterium]MBP3584275.1 hypothetical protein [Peptococcaceae bacterium]
METNSAAAKRLQELRTRTARCCCRFCGSSLEIRKIIFTGYDSRIEIFCPECDQIEYGTEPEIYLSAKYFVETMGFNYYQDLDDNEQTKKMNIAKICDIMAWENKHMGFLKENGFAVPPDLNPTILGNMLVIDDDTLNNRIAQLAEAQAESQGV